MTWSGQLIKIGTALVVMAPFALSMAAHGWSGLNREAQASPRPSLRFGEYLVSLGEIEEGARVRAIFRFENRGERSLTITDVKPSCGCLTPELPQKTYAPGERGLLLVYPHTTGAASDEADSVREHYIDVTYNAGNGPRRRRVHLKYILPERRIVVEPAGLMIYQGDSGSTRREITVTDRRAEPAIVADVRCKNENIGIEWDAADSDDPKRATISVEIPPATSSEYATVIEIHFADPQRAPVRVPLVVKALPGSEAAEISPYITPVSGQ